MGSRKRKVPRKNHQLDFYKGLPIQEKIAFKAEMWFYGRQRYSLFDFFMGICWCSNASYNQMRNMVHIGLGENSYGNGMYK